jgi:nicotinate-nucleotide adenylyltransferase
MRIAILGGSFDPIHHGHLVIARLMGEVLEADEVRLVPVGQQPLKRGSHRADPAHRARMTELAVEGAPGFVVDRFEVERPGPSYTVETLRSLRARYPGAELCLLLGSDAAALLSQWHEPDAVRQLARIVGFNRADAAEPPAGVDRFVTVPRIDISSTAVRERVRVGKSIRYWVPEAVARYIDTHGLYRDPSRC